MKINTIDCYLSLYLISSHEAYVLISMNKSACFNNKFEQQYLVC